MIITLSPQIPLDRDFQPMTLARSGRVLTINGDDFDVDDLLALEPPEGDDIVEWPEPIVRVIESPLNVVIRFPILPGSPHAAAFPLPIEDPANGPVALPDITPAETVQPEPEPPTLEEAKAARLAELAAVRWQRSQTMDYDGAADAYADSAIAVVTATVVAAQTMQQPEISLDWKLSATEWREWGLSDLIDYGQAIHAHIQGCFSREKALKGEIDAAETVEAVFAIALDGWP